jgi:hypothetical protein
MITPSNIRSESDMDHPSLQHDQLQRQLQAKRQQLPRRLRLDAEPSDRVLHRRGVRDLQPIDGCAEDRHGELGRWGVRYPADDSDEPAVDRGHADVQAVLGCSSSAPDERDGDDGQPLCSVAEGGSAAGEAQLPDHGYGGVLQQRLCHRHRLVSASATVVARPVQDLNVRGSSS